MSKVPMIDNPLGGRKVQEWIGKTPDTWPPPEKVRIRIFARAKGVCHISGRKINPLKDAYEFEHIKRMADGGQNRESNISIALKEPHREKTKRENREGNKADRARAKHLGIETEPDRKIPSPESKTEKRKREPLHVAEGMPNLMRRGFVAVGDLANDVLDDVKRKVAAKRDAAE